jgi:hypothetical protein
MFDQIEKLKTEWTDQYVEVGIDRPELARFKGLTGQVRTVNMSGRALVEWDAWNNIGWYDIEVGYLKKVPKPAPKVEEKKAEKPAAKPAAAKPAAAAGEKAAPSGEKKPSVAEMARAQGGAKKPQHGRHPGRGPR